MSIEYTLRMDNHTAKEIPMVDLAFEVLRAANVPFYYRDLMQEIAKIKELPEDEVMNVIAQLYTEINIDGRFACVGTNLWGLKRWYPVEKAEDAVGNAKRPRIINDEDDDMDDVAIFEEEEDIDSYDGDENRPNKNKDEDDDNETDEVEFEDEGLADEGVVDDELDEVDELESEDLDEEEYADEEELEELDEPSGSKAARK